jgi:hypothetical protein
MKGDATTARTFGISLEEAATISYLGDGVYATFDGDQVWLRTLEGNSIAIDTTTAQAFSKYITRQGLQS